MFTRRQQPAHGSRARPRGAGRVDRCASAHAERTLSLQVCGCGSLPYGYDSGGGQGAAIVACHAKPAQCGKTPRCEARILNSQLNIDGSGPFGGFDGRLPCGEGFLTMPPPALRRDAGDMLLTSSGSSPGFAATAKGFAPASLSFFFLSSLPLSFVAAMATASVVSHLESKRRRGRRRDQRLGGGTAAPPPA